MLKFAQSFLKSSSTAVCLILLLLLQVMLGSARAQEDRSLEETLQLLSADAAKKYVAPISSAFGADLNAGWFHRAPEAKVLGFNLEIGLVGMGSMFPDNAKTFSTSGTFKFNESEARQIVSGLGYPPQIQDLLVQQLTSQYSSVSISGPTIIGSPDEYITVLFPGGNYSVNGNTFTLPRTSVQLSVSGFKDLADMKLLPLAAPQISLGTVYGTQAVFRFLPDMELDEDLGKLKYFGFGIQHNPGVWLTNPLPLDIAASFFTQDLKIGDLFESKTTSFGINASKRFGYGMLNVTPYAGFMLESAKMNVKYDFVVETPVGPSSERVNFEVTGENKTRLTLGLNFRLGIVNLNADYNFAKYNSISAGLNFII